MGMNTFVHEATQFFGRKNKTKSSPTVPHVEHAANLGGSPRYLSNL